jgi:hypothetical protein
LVNYADKEIFPRLGTARVNGKPYTVSEFDAPFPNQYSAEALPMLAAFGRFQDWDGIFHFAYSHSKDNLDTKKTTSFFDMVGNTVKLAHLPACVAMFRRGDVSEGKTLILGGFTPKQELELFQKDRGPWNFNFKGIGLDPRLTLLYKTAFDLSGKSTENIPVVQETDFYREKGKRGSTSSGELTWGFHIKENPAFQVGTKNTFLFTGFASEPIEYDDRNISLWLKEKTRLNWATISIVSMDANGFDPAKADGKPIRVLVTATGLMQNSEMTLETLDGDKITYGNRSGKEPVLCEGIPFSLKFEKAKNLRCFPLDESGNRRTEIQTDGNSVKLGPEYKTIWYEIEIR